MSKAIGIDLGTTNSVAAFKWTEVEVVTSKHNHPHPSQTPSVVALSGGAILVGTEAVNQRSGAIRSVKRLMGRGFSDPTVQAQLARIDYSVTRPSDGTEHAVSIWLEDGNDRRELQPEDISASILERVTAHAQAFLASTGRSGTVNQAVITVPAYFDDKQRDATRRAAERARLEVIELLPEPTAAAISYGLIPGVTANNVLVYDFGGGTFDASLLVMGGNTFIEVSKAGNLWLGGDDIDQKIIAHVLTDVEREEGLTNVRALIDAMPSYDRLIFRNDLSKAIEHAKIALSSGQSAKVAPPTPFLDEAGLAVFVDVTLTRETLEALIRPLVEESLEIAKKAVADGHYSLDMVEKVLLVGGSSQIPLVQQMAAAVFGAEKVEVHPRPMTAVAEGAALRAAGAADKVGSVSRDYGIRLANDPQHLVIKRNESLPFRAVFPFQTVQDGQRLVLFEFISPDWVSGKEDHIGKMWLSLDKDYPKGTKLVLFLELEDGQEILKATASLANDASVKVSRAFSRGGADEAVYNELETLITEANAMGLTAVGVQSANALCAPVVEAANAMLDEATGVTRPEQRQRAEAALRELRRFTSSDHAEAEIARDHLRMLVEMCGDLIPAPQRTRLERLSADLDDALDRDDLSTMQAKTEEAAREVKALPSEVKLIQAMVQAVRNANQAGSPDGAVLSTKLTRIVNAFERGNPAEAGRIVDESHAMIDRWLQHSFEEQTVATGIAKS